MKTSEKIEELEKEIAELDRAGDPKQFHRFEYSSETHHDYTIAGGSAIAARAKADELRKELRELKRTVQA
jgi:polyhydroxyalkanoate synthesis regulator phasin